MQTTTRAIVLTSRKYGDTSLIVKAFTATDGMKSYLLKGILGSRKARLRAAYFQPLTQIELVAVHRNKGGLEHLRDVRIAFPYQNIATDPARYAICMFLSEILAGIIREEERNEPLYDFMESAFLWLDSPSGSANFHLLFLLELSKYLGCYPDTSNPEAPYFDLEGGQFCQSRPASHYIEGKDLEALKALMETGFEDLHTLKLSKKGRNSLLNVLLLYLEAHIQGFRKPRSLSVLNEVFT